LPYVHNPRYDVKQLLKNKIKLSSCHSSPNYWNLNAALAGAQCEVRLPFQPSGGSAGGEACECAVFGEYAGVESHPDIGVRDMVMRASPDHHPERVARFAVAEQFAEDGMGANVACRCGRKSARGFCFEAIAPGYCDARQ
jgi:hypothetical protein